MTLIGWPLEVSPDLTVLTPALVESSSGSRATTVSGGLGGFIRSSSAHAHSGGFSVLFEGGGTASQNFRLPFPAANSKVAVSFYHYAESLPPTETAIASLRHAGGVLGRVTLSPAGAVRVQTSAGISIESTVAGSWATGRWNRIELLVDNTGGAGAGKFTLSVFAGDSLTPVATISSAVGDLGSAALSHIDFGTPHTPTSTWRNWLDSVQMNDGATVFIGPYSAPAPAGPSPVVMFDGTAFIDLDVYVFDGTTFVPIELP